MLFSLYPKIKEAYNLVDSLRNVFRMKTLDRVNARNRLHEWYQKVAGCSLREVKSARDAVRFKEEEVLKCSKLFRQRVYFYVYIIIRRTNFII